MKTQNPENISSVTATYDVRGVVYDFPLCISKKQASSFYCRQSRNSRFARVSRTQTSVPGLFFPPMVLVAGHSLNSHRSTVCLVPIVPPAMYLEKLGQQFFFARPALF